MKRIGCRLRPYELNPGQTDEVLRKGMHMLEEAFLGERKKEETVAEIVAQVETIPVRREERPKVAIFGDVYVRDNDVLIRT